MRLVLSPTAVAVACVAALSTAAAQTRPLVVPAGTAPVLDGSVNEREWSKSLVARTSRGEILFRHDDRYLYVGIKAKEPGFASVCTTQGDTVSIIQGPSAVGIARYVRAGRTWQLRQDFQWQLHGAGTDDETQAARARYLHEHGMLITTKPMNAKEKELQIALDRLPNAAHGPFPIEVVYRADDGYWAWPGDPHDGCGSSYLIAGMPPEKLVFQSWKWGQIVLDRETSPRLRTAQGGRMEAPTIASRP